MLFHLPPKEYHRDVAIPYVRAYLKDGFGIEVLGGGRILHDVQRLGCPYQWVSLPLWEVSPFERVPSYLQVPGDS